MNEYQEIKVGMRFNRWLIVDLNHKTKHGRAACLATCDCGTKRIISLQSISNSTSKSCGCIFKTMRSIAIADNKHEKRNVFTNYRYRAKIKELPFELSLEHFLEAISQPCYYCGIENSNLKRVSSLGSKEGFKYNGIDRIDNTKGYTENNCVTCCNICNRAKGTLTMKEFSDWLNRIRENI